jgi:MFS family permease
MTSVGAVADPLADAYGVSLAVVGLLTTALILTHFLVQLPAGRLADRLGAHRVAVAALAACTVGNALALLDPEPSLALVARAITGLGSGAGFVAGLDYVRTTGGTPLAQGLYGAATTAGGGLAVAITPQLVGELGWRAPYWSGLVVAMAVLGLLLVAPRDRPTGLLPSGVVADRLLLPLGVVHAATFGVGIVAASWVVPLLERHGHPRRESALAGGLVLLAAVVSRPLGGAAARRRPADARALVAGSVAVAAAGLAALAAPLPLPLLALAAALVGLAAGLPFAFVFGAAQRLRPDAPAAALAFVNLWAIFAILVGAPLVGLGFDLPGDGRSAFLGLAALAVLAVPVALRSPLERAWTDDPPPSAAAAPGA